MSWGEPLTLAAAGRQDWPERDFVFGPLQPGDVGLIAGSDGVGKSFLMLAAAATVGLGVSPGNIFEQPKHTGKVLILAGEDRKNDHGTRLKAVFEQLHRAGVLVPEDDDSVTLRPLHGTRKPLVQKIGDGYVESVHAAEFRELIKNYRLVFLDPLRMFHDLQENDGAGMDFFIRWLVATAIELGVVIVVIHHASQGAILGARDDHHAGRGATDFPAGCRAVWTLRRMSPDEAKEYNITSEDERRDWRVLVNGKASHKSEGGRVWMQADQGGVLYRPSGEPGEHQDAKGAAAGQATRYASESAGFHNKPKRGVSNSAV